MLSDYANISGIEDHSKKTKKIFIIIILTENHLYKPHSNHPWIYQLWKKSFKTDEKEFNISGEICHSQNGAVG